MIDRENVIGNLEMNIRWITDHPAHQFPGWGNAVAAMTDALELLKEQEPVEPTIGRCEEYDGHDSWWYQRGKCETPIDVDDKYCRNCGKAVKWDECIK